MELNQGLEKMGDDDILVEDDDEYSYEDGEGDGNDDRNLRNVSLMLNRWD